MATLAIKNGIYHAVFRKDGKQLWRTTKLKAIVGNKRLAEREMKRIVQEHEEIRPDTYNILFSDFLLQWLKEIKPTLKPSTWEGYSKNVTGKIIPYFKKKKLRELKGKDFTRYFIYLKEHGRSNGRGGLRKKSILDIRGVLLSAYRYAIQNDMINKNVVLNSSLPLFDEDTFEATIYNDEQATLLLEEALKTNNKMCLFLHLLFATGARKGELLALTWDNVDFENKTIFICKNRTGNTTESLSILTTPKTKNGYRTLSLTDKIMEMLAKEKEYQENQKIIMGSKYIDSKYDFVIRKSDGSPYNPNSVNRIVRKLTDSLNLPPCRIHDFRHMVATKMYNSGVPTEELTIQLGHGQLSTTEKIYIHKSNIASRANIQPLSAAYGI